MLAEDRRCYKRLLFLYLQVLFNRLQLFAAIATLFMLSIDFSVEMIGMAVALNTAIMVILDSPLGVVADRWGRKKVLFWSIVLEVLALVIYGVSTIPLIYCCGLLLWGVANSLSSGVHIAVVSDVVNEEMKGVKGGTFEKCFSHSMGMIVAVAGLATMLAAVLGGCLADVFGMRWVYFLTIPFLLASMIALNCFSDVTPYANVRERCTFFEHVKILLVSLRNRRSAVLIVQIVLLGCAEYAVGIFGSLWFVGMNSSLIVIGVSQALVACANIIGGLLMRVIGVGRRVTILLFACLLLAWLGLAFSRSVITAIVMQFVASGSGIMLMTLTTGKLQKNADSANRAGVISVAFTLARLVCVPFSALFGFLCGRGGVTCAAWELVIVVFSALLIQIVVSSKN